LLWQICHKYVLEPLTKNYYHPPIFKLDKQQLWIMINPITFPLMRG
jgi:hypothetical protein